MKIDKGNFVHGTQIFRIENDDPAKNLLVKEKMQTKKHLLILMSTNITEF